MVLSYRGRRGERRMVVKFATVSARTAARNFWATVSASAAARRRFAAAL